MRSRFARAVGLTLTTALAAALLSLTAPSASAAVNGKIFYSRNSNIYSIDPDGGNNTQLTFSYRDQEPNSSADGSTIAFEKWDSSSGLNQVWTMAPDGSATTNLSSSVATSESQPALSPTANKVAFVRGSSIWTMSSGGASRVNVSQRPAGAYDSFPSWSPDGTKIAFARSESNCGSSIWIMNADGTNRYRLTCGGSYYPEFAPDGRIAFSRYVCPNYCGYEIYEVDANGYLTRLTTNASYGSSYFHYPSVSPDGTKIVVYDGNTGDMETVPVGGNAPDAIAASDGPGSWSPGVAAPGSVASLNASVSGSSVTLSWTNPNSATGNIVRRASGSSCPTTSSDGTQIGGTSLRTSQTDSSLSPGTYCYAVFANNSGGTSAPAYVGVTISSPNKPNPPGVPQYHFYQPSGLASASGGVPEQTTWDKSSTSGAVYTLQYQTNNSGQWQTLLSNSSALEYKITLQFNNTYQFRAKATVSGVDSDWAVNTPFTLIGYQEGALTYSGSWSTASNTKFWGGSVKTTRASGASVSLSFFGRNVGVIGTMGPGYGSFKEIADGKQVRTPSSYSSTTKYRQVITRWGWSESGNHTMKIVNNATPGHPKLDIDGFVIFK
jgi:hypothetical protein